MNTQIKNIALLIIRILVGGMIAWAGIQKLMDMNMTLANMSNYFQLSAPVVWAVTLGEVAAGLGILFGVYTKVAAIGAAIIMAGAVYYTKGEAMSPILLLLGSVVLIFTGGGKYICTLHKKSNTAPMMTPPTQNQTPSF
jgi:uncharacterized membrane protein YphA (DoxX/SURF4 family)